MVADSDFDEDGGAASGSSSWVGRVVKCMAGKFKVTFLAKVGLREEHDIDIASRKKGLELVGVLGEAIGIPQGQLEGRSRSQRRREKE
jgi:hypothetical protein